MLLAALCVLAVEASWWVQRGIIGDRRRLWR
jgi:hypothetical protein